MVLNRNLKRRNLMSNLNFKEVEEAKKYSRIRIALQEIENMKERLAELETELKELEEENTHE
jgi:hypothetical protein